MCCLPTRFLHSSCSRLCKGLAPCEIILGEILRKIISTVWQLKSNYLKHAKSGQKRVVKEMIAGSVPLPFSFFLFPTPPTFRVPFSFSSSPLSKSLEQASRRVMLWFSFIIGVRLYLSAVLSYVMYDNEFETKG